MYLVYGLQNSGISIIKYFEKNKQEFKIWDDNKKVRKNFEKKYTYNKFFNPNIKNLDIFKKIFVSPGISLRQKKFQIRNKSIKLNRDLNIYTSHLKKEKIIAITGTNGKSTTTKLIGDILKKNKLNTFVGGNIGKPLCDSLLTKKRYKYHVVELSSFQLETVKDFNADIAVITNLSSDHLDRYNNMRDYINQKKNILTKNGTNLISIDDIHSQNIFSNKRIKNKISFSILNKSADIFMGENFILDNYFKNSKKLYVKKISKDFEGKFNNQNILIAYICCKLLKIPEKVFIEVLLNFKGLPFRSSVIFENKKLKIINNSKSTNLNSTINSISNYNRIYLILGGIAKEENFDILLNYKKKINCVYVFGKSSILIANKLKKKIIVKKFKNLELLIITLFKDLRKDKEKSNILFAPACASYDQYNNFEERGIDFTKLVRKYFHNL